MREGQAETAGGDDAPINQVEIARRLGISQGTVHRALAGKKDVSARTREAVLALAARSHYRRNASATALRGSRFGNVGLIARQPLDGMGRTLSRLIAHISEELRRRGHNLILALPPADLPADGLPRLLTDLCVDGLVVIGDVAPAVAAAVEGSPLPVAWIDSRPGPGAGVLAIDEEASAALATGHLLARYRTVAYAGPAAGGATHYSVAGRLAGFRAACAAAGRTGLELAYPRSGGAEPLRALAAANPGLGLLCYNHVLAQLALAQFAAAGFTLPEDAGLACCDDDWMTALQEVTTLAYDEQEVSRRAIAWVCDGEPAGPAPVRRLEVRRLTGG